MKGFLKRFKMRYKEKHKIVIENCDGYSQIPDKTIEDDYKGFYHSIKKNGDVLFPFIYVTIHKSSGLTERCMVFIPKKKTIDDKDDKKFVK